MCATGLKKRQTNLKATKNVYFTKMYITYKKNQNKDFTKNLQDSLKNISNFDYILLK